MPEIGWTQLGPTRGWLERAIRRVSCWDLRHSSPVLLTVISTCSVTACPRESFRETMTQVDFGTVTPQLRAGVRGSPIAQRRGRGGRSVVSRCAFFHFFNCFNFHFSFFFSIFHFFHFFYNRTHRTLLSIACVEPPRSDGCRYTY